MTLDSVLIKEVSLCPCIEGFHCIVYVILLQYIHIFYLNMQTQTLLAVDVGN